MDSTPWAALGVIATIAIAFAGWIGLWFISRARAKPNLIVSRPTFHTADQGFHPTYAFCIGIALNNAGPGTAIHIAVTGLDPEHGQRTPVYTEMTTILNLPVGSSERVYLGLHGETPEDDPEAHDAWAFYQRMEIYVLCWDLKDRRYLFTPRGGRRLRRNEGWRTPQELNEFLYRVDPPRGEPRQSLGYSLDEED